MSRMNERVAFRGRRPDFRLDSSSSFSLIAFAVGFFITRAGARRKTRTVWIGKVPVGSEHKIAVQTMTNTRTDDVEKTVEQICQVRDAGCDIVRVTVQGMKEARGVEKIKNELEKRQIDIPLVADIHFTPKVALAVADVVDKVRVNPGNFADGVKTFDRVGDLTEEDIAVWRQKIREVFSPLVLKLKKNGRALRIGVNHGSLAERILVQYGDSPEGMVQSALEFTEICRELDFHDIVFSMKSSNPQVMVQAYRHLAKTLDERGWDYPLHLGVTEAGSGNDGRIKSAAGIGSLLLDGLGDTIRVSLTEDPIYEIKPCLALREVSKNSSNSKYPIYEKRKIEMPFDVPLNSDGAVVVRWKSEYLDEDLNYLLNSLNFEKEDFRPDAVFITGPITKTRREKVEEIQNAGFHIFSEDYLENATRVFNSKNFQKTTKLGGSAVVFDGTETQNLVKEILKLEPRVVFFHPEEEKLPKGRLLYEEIKKTKIPLLHWFRYDHEFVDSDACVISSSSDFASLLLDGIGNGLMLDAGNLSDTKHIIFNSFNLLQAVRMRITKTEYISCPSCGRTLFDLQEVTRRIQSRTGHLKGVRIAVMGCIVNGPGEMADADFGYVGSLPGKIDLYVGRECVTKGISFSEADDALIDLIKQHGKWTEPKL